MVGGYAKACAHRPPWVVGRCPKKAEGQTCSACQQFSAIPLEEKIIERHLTLDRTMYGSDQAASLEPMAFAKMVREIRDWEIARGDGEIRRLECETAVREKLRRVR